MSHTPGPWEVKREYGLRQRIQTSGDKGTLAYLVSRPFAHGGNFSHEQITDNARLIAAAPDLLGVLKDLLAQKCFTCDCGVGGEVFEKAEAAIAKAEGK